MVYGMIAVLIVFVFDVIQARENVSWVASDYPDIRGATADQCLQMGKHRQQSLSDPLFICDPESILPVQQALALNVRLDAIARNTTCYCQRQSQCGIGANGDANIRYGFLLSVAIMHDIQLQGPTPSDEEKEIGGKQFCKKLHVRWALGDCGNSIIVVVWRYYKKILICPAYLAQKYVTPSEQAMILSKWNHLIMDNEWYDALSNILNDISREMHGDPEKRTDVGTISLIVSVGVSIAITLIITICVCAFRCCGNLYGDEGSVAGKVDSLRNSIIRRGSSFRRSISRSPKFSPRENNIRFFSENTLV